MLAITSSKVTAIGGPNGWAQVHEFTPDNQDTLRLRGRLFAVLASKNSQDGIDTIASGREMIGRLHEEYFGKLEGKPYDVLRNAVQRVIDDSKEKWGDVEIAACTFVDGVMFSAAVGGAKVLISRDGVMATILASDGGIIAASGYPKNGDMVLLGTKEFLEKITTEVLSSTLALGDPLAASETFAPIIHGGGEGGAAASIIMKFQDGQINVDIPKPILPEKPKEISVLKKIGFLASLIKKIPQRSIYLKQSMGDEVSSQSKKMTFSAGVILLVILVVSIGFGIRQKGINDLKKKYQGILATAQGEVDQAISLASLDSEKSRELFVSSEQKLNEILALKVKDPKVAELQRQIEESRGAILGEYDTVPTLFLDLSLLSSGFNGNSLSSSGGNVFILDKAGKRIVSVAIDTKKSKVTAGPSVLDGVEDIASYQDTVYGLFSDGIYEVGVGKTKVIEKTWTGDALISAFAGNLYVMDKIGNTIYRYSGLTGGTFGTGQNWLSASTNVNFANVIGWGMDGAIYALYPNARVLKYSLGSPQNFSISGAIPEIGKIDAINADPDNQYLYLLDKAGKRVVVIDKKGKYKAQYIGDQIGDATSLVVSESQRLIILLTGDKLLSIEIKN